MLDLLKDDVLVAARPEGQKGGLGREVTVRKAVDAAEPKIAGAFKDQPALQAEVRTRWARCTLASRVHPGDPAARARLELRRTKLGPDHLDTLTSRA